MGDWGWETGNGTGNDAGNEAGSGRLGMGLEAGNGRLDMRLEEFVLFSTDLTIASIKAIFGSTSLPPLSLLPSFALKCIPSTSTILEATYCFQEDTALILSVCGPLCMPHFVNSK